MHERVKYSPHSLSTTGNTQNNQNSQRSLETNFHFCHLIHLFHHFQSTENIREIHQFNLSIHLYHQKDKVIRFFVNIQSIAANGSHSQQHTVAVNPCIKVIQKHVSVLRH